MKRPKRKPIAPEPPAADAPEPTFDGPPVPFGTRPFGAELDDWKPDRE